VSDSKQKSVQEERKKEKKHQDLY